MVTTERTPSAETAVPATGFPVYSAVPSRLRYIRQEPGTFAGGVVESCDGAGAMLERLDLLRVARSVPCFTPGTLIATPAGEVPVERLRAGDLVITRDNGPQPLLWIGQRDFGWRELAMMPLLRPVRIAPGAVGPGMAGRALTVSPNHLVLVGATGAEGHLAGREAFIAARDLVGLPGVAEAEVTAVRYLHLMCARHEVLLTDGVWSESLRHDREVVSAFAGPAGHGMAVARDLARTGGTAEPFAPAESGMALARDVIGREDILADFS